MGGSHALRPGTLVGLTAGACAAVTAAMVIVPSVHLAYREPSLRVALETASVLIALLMALLVHGRARRTRSTNELALALGIGWLAAANLFTAALVVTELQVEHLRTLSFATGAVGACLIAVAAIVPGWALPAWRDLARRLPLAAFGFTVARAGARRRRHHRSGAPPNPATVHVAHFSPMLIVQLVATAGFALGAVGFARQAARHDDRFLAWVAVALTVAAFGRLNDALSPPARPQWVYAGDGFRVLFHTLLLAAALREIAGVLAPPRRERRARGTATPRAGRLRTTRSRRSSPTSTGARPIRSARPTSCRHRSRRPHSVVSTSRGARSRR